MSLDKSKYGELIKELVLQYSLDNDQWPKDLKAAHRAAQNHVWDQAWRDKKARERAHNQEEESKEETPKLTFAQIAEKCKCCGKSGHKDDACYSRSKPKHLWYCNTNQEAKQFYQAAAARRCEHHL